LILVLLKYSLRDIHIGIPGMCFEQRILGPIPGSGTYKAINGYKFFFVNYVDM
jgi:hypothetical protein